MDVDGLRLQHAGGMSGTFLFDGRRIAFAAGQSVGSALWEAGIRPWRDPGSPERFAGWSCGVDGGVDGGVDTCLHCLVVVDGQPEQRACLVPARRDLDVRTQPAPP